LKITKALTLFRADSPLQYKFRIAISLASVSIADLLGLKSQDHYRFNVKFFPAIGSLQHARRKELRYREQAGE
jgi:hypothetical protein